MRLLNSKKYNIICIIINRLFKKRYYVFYIVEKNIVIEICVRILFHYIFRILLNIIHEYKFAREYFFE